MLCSYRCWTASWQMCGLLSPNYAAWRSQEPKHHTLSSAPRWWSHANPSEKYVALGNKMEKLHLQRRILPESFKNHGPRIWQFNLLPCTSYGFPFAYQVSLIVLCHFPLRDFVLMFLSYVIKVSFPSQNPYVTWIFSLLAMSNAVLETKFSTHSDSGNLLLFRWNYTIVNFKAEV